MTRGKIPWQSAKEGGYPITQWEIEGDATALLLIDLQEANLDPKVGAGPSLWAEFPDIAGYYYDRLEESVLPTVLELQAFARLHHLPVIYTASGLALPDGRDVAPWSWRASRRRPGSGIPCLLPPGAPGRGLWADLNPRPDELLLEKQTLSPFNGTPLEQVLRNMGIENLIIGGLLTNAAVETTARDAGDRGFNAMVIEEACAALTAEEHEATVGSASWYVVKTKSEVVDQLGPLLAH
ncbi:MAG TPA: isochorismatase family cysteine hydrolase [Chloroflexota bacterium]|jgi:nicotinamidase-related amidase